MKSRRHTHKFALKCVMCGAAHDRATGVNTTEPPRNGQVTMCFACGAWLVFDNTVIDNCRPPTSTERLALKSNKGAQEMMLAWLAMKVARDRAPGD